MAYRILAVVGARPQFIKAAIMADAIERQCGFEHILVHTGQHYDANMSQIFFDELNIPFPKINLGISGGSHAAMTGKMLIELEKTMIDEKPDCILLYGDTNSTLAGALAAAKLGIPICHAESGARTHSRNNPEEINRVCTDHLAIVNCAPTPTCYRNLVEEGLASVSEFTGDLMYDAFKKYVPIAIERVNQFLTLDGKPYSIDGEGFCYMTCHRQENASVENLCELFKFASMFDNNVIYPVHPRMSKIVSMANENIPKNLILLAPVGYFESLDLLNRCGLVVTDSGGLQREAFFAEKKCITLLPFPSTEELLEGNRNTLVSRVDADTIFRESLISQSIDSDYMPFGNGDAAVRITEKIMNI